MLANIMSKSFLDGAENENSGTDSPNKRRMMHVKRGQLGKDIMILHFIEGDRQVVLQVVPDHMIVVAMPARPSHPLVYTMYRRSTAYSNTGYAALACPKLLHVVRLAGEN